MKFNKYEMNLTCYRERERGEYTFVRICVDCVRARARERESHEGTASGDEKNSEKLRHRDRLLAQFFVVFAPPSSAFLSFIIAQRCRKPTFPQLR